MSDIGLKFDGLDAGLFGLLNGMVIGVFQLVKWYPLCHGMLYSVYRMSSNDGFIYFIIVLLILSGPLAFFVFCLFIVDSVLFGNCVFYFIVS